MNYTSEFHDVELPDEFLPLWNAENVNERMLHVHNLSIRAAAKAARDKSSKQWVRLVNRGRTLATLSLRHYLNEQPIAWVLTADTVHALFRDASGQEKGMGPSRGGVTPEVDDPTLVKNPRGEEKNGELT